MVNKNEMNYNTNERCKKYMQATESQPEEGENEDRAGPAAQNSGDGVDMDVNTVVNAVKLHGFPNCLKNNKEMFGCSL